MKSMLYIVMKTFFVFVIFGEKLCTKRYDTNELKTLYLNSSKCKLIAMNRNETFLAFVKFLKTLCTKRYDTNDLKTRYLNSSKRKKIVMNRKEKFHRVSKIW